MRLLRLVGLAEFVVVDIGELADYLVVGEATHGVGLALALTEGGVGDQYFLWELDLDIPVVRDFMFGAERDPICKILHVSDLLAWLHIQLGESACDQLPRNLGNYLINSPLPVCLDHDTEPIHPEGGLRVGDIADCDGDRSVPARDVVYGQEIWDE